MKKALIISTASALLGLSSAYAMKPMYYVGAGVGMANNNLNSNTLVTNQNTKISSTVFDLETGAKFGLKNNINISAAAFFGINDFNERGGDFIRSTKVATPFNFGLISRAGKAYESFEGYAILGVGFQHVRNEISFQGTSISKDKVTSFARIGAGVEHAVNSSLKAYLEYTYDIAFNRNKEKQTINGNAIESNVKVETSALKVGARYFFSKNS